MPLKTELSEPQSPITPQGPVRDNSTAYGLNQIGGMLDAVGGIMRKREAEQLETDRNLAVGQTTQQILDLEDESIRQQQTQTSLEGEAFKLAQDGVTEEEQKRLDEIQSEQKRLNLLKPGERRLRLNALHKQALNDMANLNIQPQINALFSQGRSRVLAPINTANQQLDAQMDARYGVGNWTAADRGRVAGNMEYQREQIVKANTNFSLVQDNAKYNAMIQMDDAIQNLSKTYINKGHLSEDDKEMFAITIDNNIAAQRQQIQHAINTNAQNGIDIRPTAQKYLEDLENSRAQYMSLLKGDARFGDSKSTLKTYERINKITEEVNKLGNAQAGAAFVNMMGSGGSGDFDTLLQIVNMNDRVFQTMIDQAPEGLGGTIAETKTQAVKALNHLVTGQMRPEELAAKGLFSPRLLKVVAAQGVQKSTEAEVIDKHIESLRTQMSKEDNLGVLDVMNNSATIANVKSFGSNKDVRTQVQMVAATSLDVLLREGALPASELDVVDGKIVVKRFQEPDKPAATGAQMFGLITGRRDNYTQAVADGLNKMIDNYGDMIDSKELFGELERLSEKDNFLNALIKTEESE